MKSKHVLILIKDTLDELIEQRKEFMKTYVEVLKSLEHVQYKKKRNMFYMRNQKNLNIFIREYNYCLNMLKKYMK